MVTLEQLNTFVLKLADAYAENAAYLTDLDSAIGDADHGINMNRGFQSVRNVISETKADSISGFLKTVSMQLIKTVGGASGPLYGTFFLKASLAAKDKDELTASDLFALFQAGYNGVLSLGKAVVGDKTMVDTWAPALQAMEESQGSIKEMLAKGLEAAEKGMKSTIELLAKKGRASYLGERSIGHQDPGATSSYLLIKAASEIFE